MSGEGICGEHLREAVIAFRLGIEGQGSDRLAKFIDCLLPMLQGATSGLGATETALLEALFAAQSRGDFLYVADLLEFELPNSGFGAFLNR